MRFFTMCGGFGLADIGIARAGGVCIGSIEYDPQLAAVYAQNHGAHVTVADIRQVDWHALPVPEYIHASPPCPSFSQINPNRAETDADLAIADAISAAVRLWLPRLMTIENVAGYQKSESLRRIMQVFGELDYAVEIRVVDAADYGVPQNRHRLIIVARSGGWMQPGLNWGVPVPHVGWHATIADLLPDLPTATLPPWQFRRLPETLRTSMLLGQQAYNDALVMLPPNRPAMMITANPNQTTMRAILQEDPPTFLIDGKLSNHGKYLTLRSVHQPSSTVVTSMPIANDMRIINVGRVFRITPRCLARWQSVPDTFILPNNARLAVKGIGNGYPSLLAQRIYEMGYNAVR